MDAKKVIATVATEAQERRGGREPLASYLGVTPNAVTEWRKGRATPNATHLLKMLVITGRVTLGAGVFALSVLAMPTDGNAGFNISVSANQIHIVSNWIKDLLRRLVYNFLTPRREYVR